MSPAPQEFAMSYSRAWAEHDPDAIVAMHTDDTVFHIHGDAEPATGHAAVREAIAALFDQSPDLRFESRRVHFGEGHFVSEYEISGTAAGRPSPAQASTCSRMAMGRVARKDAYIDWLAFERQVGIDATVAASS